RQQRDQPVVPVPQELGETGAFALQVRLLQRGEVGAGGEPPALSRQDDGPDAGVLPEGPQDVEELGGERGGQRVQPFRVVQPDGGAPGRSGSRWRPRPGPGTARRAAARPPRRGGPSTPWRTPGGPPGRTAARSSPGPPSPSGSPARPPEGARAGGLRARPRRY